MSIAEYKLYETNKLEKWLQGHGLDNAAALKHKLKIFFCVFWHWCARVLPYTYAMRVAEPRDFTSVRIGPNLDT